MHVDGTQRHSRQCPGAVWGGYIKPSWLQGAGRYLGWERGKCVWGQCGVQFRKGRNAPPVDGAHRAPWFAGEL